MSSGAARNKERKPAPFYNPTTFSETIDTPTALSPRPGLEMFFRPVPTVITVGYYRTLLRSSISLNRPNLIIQIGLLDENAVAGIGFGDLRLGQV